MKNGEIVLTFESLALLLIRLCDENTSEMFRWYHWLQNTNDVQIANVTE